MSPSCFNRWRGWQFELTPTKAVDKLAHRAKTFQPARRSFRFSSQTSCGRVRAEKQSMDPNLPQMKLDCCVNLFHDSWITQAINHTEALPHTFQRHKRDSSNAVGHAARGRASIAQKAKLTKRSRFSSTRYKSIKISKCHSSVSSPKGCDDIFFLRSDVVVRDRQIKGSCLVYIS